MKSKLAISSLLVSTVALLSGASVSAQNIQAKMGCVQPKLFDFAMYSAGNITGQSSDFQGLTGAKGTIFLTNFLIEQNSKNCLSLSSGKGIEIYSAQVTSNVESGGGLRSNAVRFAGGVNTAGNVNIDNSNIVGTLNTSGKVKATRSSIKKVIKENLEMRVDHDLIISEMKLKSLELSNLRATGIAQEIPSASGNKILLDATGDVSVFNITAQQLHNTSLLLLQGAQTQKIIVNINGEEIYLVGKDMKLAGGLKFENIIWNIHEAKYVKIQNTANGNFGIPGFVMAPLANVEFYEGLITGGLYVGNLFYNLTNTGLSTGQINRKPIEGRKPFN